MVGMQVAPAHPLPLGHLQKHRMRLEAVLPGLPGESLNQLQQRLPIRLKISGRGAVQFLVNLRPRRKSMGPVRGQVKRAPLDQSAPAKVWIDRNCSLTHRAQECIIQMAHHLPRIHPAPAPLEIGTQPADAFHNLSLHIRLVEGLQGCPSLLKQPGLKCTSLRKRRRRSLFPVDALRSPVRLAAASSLTCALRFRAARWFGRTPLPAPVPGPCTWPTLRRKCPPSRQLFPTPHCLLRRRLPA